MSSGNSLGPVNSDYVMQQAATQQSEYAMNKVTQQEIPADQVAPSQNSAQEPTFTLAQVQHFFGSRLANKFAASMEAGITTSLSALSLASVTGDEVSTVGSLSALSIASRDNISLDDRPTSGVSTAMSRTMITGAEASDPAVTAVSRTMLTGAEASDLAVTARSRSMMTGVDRSASCVTGRANSTTAMTAVSRTMLTGAEASDPARTAVSRTMLTGYEASDPAVTAVSRTMLTGAEKSLSATTARGEFWEDDLKTAMQVVWEKEGLSSEDMKTALSASSEALADQMLTSAPSTDSTAANAVPSIDTMTALEA